MRLPEHCPVLLGANVTRNRDNFANRRVPVFNADPVAMVASMDKVGAPPRAESSTLWLKHDTAQSASLPRAPR